MRKPLLTDPCSQQTPCLHFRPALCGHCRAQPSSCEFLGITGRFYSVCFSMGCGPCFSPASPWVLALPKATVMTASLQDT